MNYRDKREIVEGKVKRIKYIALAVTIFLVAALCVFSIFFPARTWKYHVALPETSARKKGELRIHYIDVGQGDATLLEFPDGKTMLIDGGNGAVSTEKTLLRYLNSLKINALDYLVVTHEDGDHCGGLSAVVENKTVKTAFLPYVSDVTENAAYARLYDRLLKEDCKIEYASRKLSLSMDGEYSYTLEFLYPKTKSVEGDMAIEQEDDNENSSVLWLDYKGVSALFCGDATERIERTLLLDDELGAFKNRNVFLRSTEILKVAHHGSSTSSCADFLKYLNLQTAIVSCGADNVYGHPTQATLDRLAAVNANVMRTDKLGHIVITVTKDGKYKTETIKN